VRDQVQAALREYDPSQDEDRLRLAAEERDELLKRFPQEHWPDMQLSEYAVGQEDSSNSFCRWMEFKAIHLGSIKGGSSRKLIIYKRKKGPGWHYDEAAFGSVEEAWAAVRGQFVAAMDYAARGEWVAIEDLSALRAGQALLVKTLHLYFPADLLPINSREHLRHFLGLLEQEEASDSKLGAVTLNRVLLKAMAELNDHDLSTAELGYFLYRHFPPKSSARWFKISPGRQAEFWDACRQGGFACVGWDEIGDLREFGGKDEFLEAFNEAYGPGTGRYNDRPNVISRKANELWRLMELRPGDRIVANKGTSRILAVGTVREPVYEHDATRGTYKHLGLVDWDESYAGEIPPQPGWLNTIDRVTVEQRKLIEHKGKLEGSVGADIEVDPIYEQIADALLTKGQVVLYGPPGTGKTFHARHFAAWWLQKRSGHARPETVFVDLASLKAAEMTLSDGASADSGDVRPWSFTTFHPSYAYEDFVEGYRPAPNGDGDIDLKLEDGIFKRICRAASQDSGTTYLLVIDEINRANVAKVFGELITMLERDKRGLPLTLPQSKERFVVPENVFLLGTMNTADRSVTLLDVALRRRFAFVELMPDLDLIDQAVGPLKLADFLGGLNREVARIAGREKQIGHAYLMPEGRVVADPVEFARVFWMEIVPLLQEYCYEEYGQLAEILGESIVDTESQTLNVEMRDDPDALVEGLATQFLASAADSDDVA
jgi:5-methylcytosine-specific restriction protein B